MNKLFLSTLLFVLSTACYAASTKSYKKIWSAPTGKVAYLQVDGSNVYYATDTHVGLVDGGTGKIVWSQNLDPLYWRPTIAYENGILCVDASGSVIIAYDAKTGHKLWTRPVSSDYSHPIAIHNGKVYCQLNRTVMGALDVRTHATLWKVPMAIGGAGSAFNMD